MKVEIFCNGQSLDLYEDTDIKFTFQVNDIAEVKDRQANYTNAFTIPRTARNINIFKGLGVPSDTSNIPYLKSDCVVKVEGLDLIPSGWLNITETTDKEYKINIYSGLIDFFKAIENKTLSEIIGTDLDHEKRAEVIAENLKKDIFAYLIADYNGRMFYTKDRKNYLNTDTLIPSISVKYLWEKLHSYAQFTQELSLINTTNFKNLYLTYPKPISFLESTEIYNQGEDNKNSYYPSGGYWYYLISASDNEYYEVVGKDGIRQPAFQSGSNTTRYSLGKGLRFKKKGKYTVRIDLSFTHQDKAFASVSSLVIGSLTRQTLPPFSSGSAQELNEAKSDFDKLKNAITIPQSSTPTEIFLDVYAEAGDIAVFPYYLPPIPRVGTTHYMWDIKHYFRFYFSNIENISDVFSDLSATDFIKEIINLFGLTIFQNDKKVTYKTLKERLSADILDWTRKYISRQNETYIYENYAQKNTFKFQNSDKEANYKDDFLSVNNKNIDSGKVVFTSKTYASEQDYSTETLPKDNIPVIKVFDKEPVSNPKEGEEPIKYKLLNKRFHFVYATEGVGEINFGNFYNQTDTYTLTDNILFADTDKVNWSFFLRNYYTEFGSILNNSRLHKIELNLNLIDILKLDFEKIYYFAQEQQYYLLNKLNFDQSKTIGEFVRVDILPKSLIASIEEPDIPTQEEIKIYWFHNNELRIGDTRDKEGANGSVQFGSETPLFYQYKKLNSDNWSDFNDLEKQNIKTFNANEYTTYEFRGFTFNEQNERIYSNILRYKKIQGTTEIVYKQYLVTAYTDLFEFTYIDKEGQTQYISEYSHYEQQHNRTVCAVENSIQGERIEITLLGDC